MIVEKSYFRKYQLGDTVNNREIFARFPCEEDKIQKICEKLDVENLANTKIQVISVDDKEINKMIAGQKTTLDELNYLEKRLQSFSSDEMKLFQCVGQALESENMKDFINSTYNLHCYSLIDGSKDLDTLGRELYLHEAISCPTEELKQLNGQKYLLELMKNYEPWETDAGLLYPNKNQPTTMYHGTTLPPFSYGRNPIEVVLNSSKMTNGESSELLTLPYHGSDLGKTMERIGVKSYQDLKIEEIHILIPPKDNVLADFDLSCIQNAEQLDELSYVAEFYDLGVSYQISQLKLFCEELKVDTLREVCEVCSAVLTEELEFVPNIQTAEDYGYFLVCENESTKIDDDISAFVDYQGYGESQLYGKQYISTKNGLIVYDGDSGMMEAMLTNLQQKQEEIEMNAIN